MLSLFYLSKLCPLSKWTPQEQTHKHTACVLSIVYLSKLCPSHSLLTLSLLASLLSPATILGLTQNVCYEVCVRCTFSYSNLHDMAVNSITEIPEVGVQLPEWWATLHLYVGQCVQVWGNSCTYYLLTQPWVDVRVLFEECSQTSEQAL